MSDNKSCISDEQYYLQNAMNSFGGKWKLPILYALTSNGPSRYNDILRSINGISNTMLAKSLKELEELGMVTRKEYLEVPVRVEYEITGKARELCPILSDLIKWEMKWSPKSE